MEYLCRKLKVTSFSWKDEAGGLGVRHLPRQAPWKPPTPGRGAAAPEARGRGWGRWGGAALGARADYFLCGSRSLELVSCPPCHFCICEVVRLACALTWNHHSRAARSLRRNLLSQQGLFTLGEQVAGEMLPRAWLPEALGGWMGSQGGGVSTQAGGAARELSGRPLKPG